MTALCSALLFDSACLFVCFSYDPSGTNVSFRASVQRNMSAAKLMGKRTHQMPGRLNVSELFFEVPKDYSNPQSGSLRLFARSVERFEKPVDASKKELKQPPWCTHYSI